MPFGPFTIPAWVRDHESFRRWARSSDCPEKLRISFLRDTLRVELAREEFWSHNQVRGEIYSVLASLEPNDLTGLLVAFGMLLTNLEAEFSTQPDFFFVTYDSMDSGRMQEVPEGVRCVELVGTPDVIGEVVSDSSELRDTVELRDLYFRAGIPEYWLIDARREATRFEIFRRGPNSYVSVLEEVGGWLMSEFFGRAFRLTRDSDPLGHPRYTLEMK